MLKKSLFVILAAGALASCSSKDDPAPTAPKLIFKFKFDAQQERLDNLGRPSSIAAGNAGQSPVFRGMSAHYIELAPLPTTLLEQGTVLYKNAETTAGGARAIDFSKSKIAADGETFFEIPLKDVKPGKYEYLRVSLAYQSYDIKINVAALGQEITGTVASFIGYNTYIGAYKIKDSTVTLNGNRPQGYWSLEVPTKVVSAQAPAGATTVPNPLAGTSPIPPGSCVVTGPFTGGLSVTGNETKDLVVTVSLSVNKSFEWKDTNGNGKFDVLEGETVVDMGIRGLKTIINQ
ncbi:hypothetical protein [Chitinophaga barathri]|uniref:Uncharacterized protein n=1 Tax=Chitinophaga barathri TaxID=1647451 RepID=A0A3N4MGG2_9BACT|nr:hypothetical protein [Chitinophaga barathri]RPD43054.1 hypothetical protein EG028_01825 [Chitinophaga barathri]